ncbi:hypothetical protein KEM63_16660 [Halopseudomonas nanhaiensis]|uniref:hypothetical protein n=1 Tax=Halopseudomonas nanhaiensis TaxID=2830842 RepID=UPI001CBE8DE8|nr:hypothetical protein [Halopseudomonas nanhaiensis]UAW98375.1 hypothetical protein KEM63_16660 [Halopseudomonas nanhaiensis]
MKANTVHYTWMAFSLAAIVMLGLQHSTNASSEQQAAPGYAFEHNLDQNITPVSLPVVTRQVSQLDAQAQQRPTFTF